MEVGIIALIVASVGVASSIGSYIHSYLRMRSTEQKLIKRLKRPSTGIIVQEAGSPFVFTPQFFGSEVEHKYTIQIRYPPGSQITAIQPGSFIVTAGGLGKDFIELEKGIVRPGEVLRSISISCNRAGAEIFPEEVLTWTQEETGFISIPYMP